MWMVPNGNATVARKKETHVARLQFQPIAKLAGADRGKNCPRSLGPGPEFTNWIVKARRKKKNFGGRGRGQKKGERSIIRRVVNRAVVEADSPTHPQTKAKSSYGKVVSMHIALLGNMGYEFEYEAWPGSIMQPCFGYCMGT